MPENDEPNPAEFECEICHEHVCECPSDEDERRMIDAANERTMSRG